MPEATPFTALGRGNGFPFCLLVDTSSNITAINGQTLEPNDETILRAREVTLSEAMNFIWSLYSVGFASKNTSGNDIDFDDGLWGYGAVSDGAVNADQINPEDRACLESFDFDLSTRTNVADYWGVAQGDAQGFFTEVARFEIHAVAYASDTKKFYIIYGAGYYADDTVTLIVEADWSDLSFDFYTYP